MFLNFYSLCNTPHKKSGLKNYLTLKLAFSINEEAIQKSESIREGIGREIL